MKICNKCLEEKDLSEFSPSKTGKLGVAAKCKRCKAESNRQYRSDNKDHVNEIRKSTPSYKNKSIQDKKFWDKHGDRINGQRRESKTHKERANELKRIDRAANPEKYKAYYEASKESHYEANARRRAQKSKIPNTMPKNFMKLLVDFYGDQCMNPDCPYEIDSWNILSLDHVIPITLPGSSHSLENSQILCRRCNSSKSNTIADYRNGKILSPMRVTSM